jgi:hypothetical protein
MTAFYCSKSEWLGDDRTRIGHDGKSGYIEVGRRMNQNRELVIGMIAAYACFSENGQSELFGFWYYKEMGLPASREEKRAFFHDLMIGRCCQLSLKGSIDQIRHILELSEEGVREMPSYSELHEGLTLHGAIRVTFDDLAAPEGTSLELNIPVRVTDTTETVIQKVKSCRDVVELELEPGWSIVDETKDFGKAEDEPGASISQAAKPVDASEIILNLWYFVDEDQQFIFSLSGRAYIANGTDDEKISLLKQLACTDFPLAVYRLVPDRYVSDFAGKMRPGIALVSELDDSATQLFEELYRAIEEDFVKMAETQNRTVGDFKIPENPLFVMTALYLDDYGEIHVCGV